MRQPEKNNSVSRILRSAVLIMLCAVLLCVSVPISAADKVTETDVKNLEYQIQQNLANQRDVEAKLSAAKKQMAAETKTKQYIDTKLNLLETNIADTEALIAMYAEDIAVKEVEISDKNAEIDRQYAEIQKYLRLSYEDKVMNYLEIILSAGSLTELFTNIERVGNMIDYQNRMVKALNDNLAELEAMKAALVEQQTKNEEQMTALLEQKEEFEQLAAESEAYMQSLQRNQATYTRLQAEYKATENELNKELEEMLAELAKQTPAYVGGELGWPMPLANKRISSWYGWRDLYGTGKKDDFHLGIDIPGATGTNIYAANSGTVVTAKWHYSYGNYVVIDHGGGRSTLYAHASKLLVKVGDKVSKGDTIALCGNTGNSFGSHLHFEVRINGKTTDPMGYVVQPK